MNLSKEEIESLSRPFPDDIIGVKVNNFNKARTQAMLILYLQHTDVYARIEEIDPSWTCAAGAPYQVETVGFGGQVKKIIAVPMKMTIKNVCRENIGEGEDYKSAYSDALKRVAMLFGVGRYLYDSPQVWVPYNKATDKYKKWTIFDFRNKGTNTPPKVAPPTQPKEDTATAYFDSLPQDQDFAFEELPESTPLDDGIVNFGIHKNKKFSEVIKNKSYMKFVKEAASKPGVNKKTSAGLLALFEYAMKNGSL